MEVENILKLLWTFLNILVVKLQQLIIIARSIRKLWEPFEMQYGKDVLKILNSFKSILRKFHSNKHPNFHHERPFVTMAIRNHCRDPNGRRLTDTNIWVFTVPRYAENHNPMLPLNLQQKLDGMSPRDFLSYVLNDLTLEERESLMIDERQRRRSFQAGWPRSGDLSGDRMARAGFYSVDSSDRVQCVFCRGCLHQWEPDDNPMVEHSRSFNFCRFVKGLQCGNKEYMSNKLSIDDLRNITMFQKVDGETDSGLLGISTNRAATIQYAPDSTRLRTFSRWPASSPIAAQRMCDAGFFYTGFDDQVCCFYCDGGIKDWAAADDPWKEHVRWFPDCTYLIQKKGQQFVDEIYAKTPANKKCVRKIRSRNKDVINAMKRRHEQASMEQACIVLGHHRKIIQQAIEINGGHFDCLDKMIDMIYIIEKSGNTQISCKRNRKKRVAYPDDGGENFMNFSSSSALEFKRARKEDSSDISDIARLGQQSVCLEEIQRGRKQDEQVTGSAGSERRHKYEQGCRRCELKVDTFVPATHVGLPCGHLILCESCNREETNKATSDSTYFIRCPFYGCGAFLTGSIRVYFA